MANSEQDTTDINPYSMEWGDIDDFPATHLKRKEFHPVCLICPLHIPLKTYCLKDPTDNVVKSMVEQKSPPHSPVAVRSLSLTSTPIIDPVVLITEQEPPPYSPARLLSSTLIPNLSTVVLELPPHSPARVLSPSSITNLIVPSAELEPPLPLLVRSPSSFIALSLPEALHVEENAEVDSFHLGGWIAQHVKPTLERTSSPVLLSPSAPEKLVDDQWQTQSTAEEMDHVFGMYIDLDRALDSSNKGGSQSPVSSKSSELSPPPCGQPQPEDNVHKYGTTNPEQSDEQVRS